MLLLRIKVVIQMFKTLAINAFQSFRLDCITLRSGGEFNALETVRSLNGMDFFGDFINLCTNELITHKDSLFGINSPLQSVQISTAPQSTANEAPQISIQIRKNKRRRFEYFLTKVK